MLHGMLRTPVIAYSAQPFVLLARIFAIWVVPPSDCRVLARCLRNGARNASKEWERKNEPQTRWKAHHARREEK